MGSLEFYRHHRVDGGVRTGIEVNGETVLGLFEEGDPEYDPVLLWYVHLRCQGPGLPEDAEGARRWLIDHAALIRDGFARCARENSAGVDPDIYPMLWSDFHGAPEAVQITIAFSASRRAEAVRLAEVLGEIGSHWEEILGDLQPLEPITP